MKTLIIQTAKMSNIIKNILNKAPFAKRNISKIQAQINAKEENGLLNRWKTAWSNVRQMSKKPSKSSGNNNFRINQIYPRFLLTT